MGSVGECRWTPPCSECRVTASQVKPRYSIEQVDGRWLCRDCRDRAGREVEPAEVPVSSRWCDECTEAIGGTHLPPHFGSCSPGRKCRVCGEPLPGAVVHATVHGDCERLS